MLNKVLVPDIGDFEKVEIIEVLVKTGDKIKKNDSIVTLESDKSSVEVPSTLEGTVENVNIKIGDKVSKGDLLISVKTEGSKTEETKKEEKEEKIPIDTEKIIKEAELLGKKAKIIAVSKNHPKEFVEDALKNGVRIFGENRVQEAKIKFEDLKAQYPNIELHLTGPLQTNKTKEATKLFDVFHTLDREKLAKEFIKQGDLIKNKKFFIQVNTGREETKSGIYLEHLDEFIKYCKNDLLLNIIGLMCIPPVNDPPQNHFSALEKEAKKHNLLHLSMGMSDDYIEAIKHNATYIRIGTSLFGKRQK